MAPRASSGFRDLRNCLSSIREKTEALAQAINKVSTIAKKEKFHR
jgi:hypothetical protein